MSKKRWFLISIVCLGIGAFLLTGTDSLRSEDEQGKGVVETPAVEETDIAIPTAQPNQDELSERHIFISVPEIFEELDRAPVKFYHDKHTSALEPEGCEVCHPQDKEKKFDFSYPKIRDEKDKDALMNAFHDDCIGCHNEKAQEGKKSGPVTCGECHKIEEEYHTRKYLPILPEYYEPLRDTYHGECLNCHKEPAKAAEEAGDLDWKYFYVKEEKKLEEEWPKVVFDYYIHDKHEKALEEKCELCHYISPDLEKQLAAEGKEPSCKDWLREIPEDRLLTEEETAHPQCINCHLERKNENRDSGPVYCKECHTGIERTPEELRDVPRIECEQEERILIQIEEDARMQGVAFNHKSHQENTWGCQQCHHDTLRACKECHTAAGSEEGDFINLAEAYHEVSSPWSCIGCHEREKQKPDCAGCHHIMKSGLAKSACTTCHSGRLETLDAARKLPAPEDLLPDDTKDEMEITILENEYKPSKFTHLAIVKRLTEISNESSLASYFHVDETAMCAGCHHFEPVEKKTSVAQCSACHTARKEPQRSIPALLGAYHQQCLGCHKQMGGTEEEMPQDCAGCHEEKAKG